jgi:hypothetical protein
MSNFGKKQKKPLLNRYKSGFTFGMEYTNSFRIKEKLNYLWPETFKIDLHYVIKKSFNIY